MQDAPGMLNWSTIIVIHTLYVNKLIITGGLQVYFDIQPSPYPLERYECWQIYDNLCMDVLYLLYSNLWFACTTFDKDIRSQKVQSMRWYIWNHSYLLRRFTPDNRRPLHTVRPLVGGTFQQCSLPRASPITKAMIMQIFKNDMAQNMPLIGKPTIRTHNMLLDMISSQAFNKDRLL